MARARNIRFMGLDLPMWVGNALRAVGISTIIYGLIRYTFIGEFFERLYRDTVGHSPVDDLVDSFNPEKDIETMKDDMRMLEDSL